METAAKRNYSIQVFASVDLGPRLWYAGGMPLPVLVYTAVDLNPALRTVRNIRSFT